MPRLGRWEDGPLYGRQRVDCESNRPGPGRRVAVLEVDVAAPPSLVAPGGPAPGVGAGRTYEPTFVWNRYSKSCNNASGLIKIIPGPIFGPILGSIPWGSGPKMCPKRAGALLGHISGPDPNGMYPKIGPKIGPGRILIKPEALLRDLEDLEYIFDFGRKRS